MTTLLKEQEGTEAIQDDIKDFGKGMKKHDKKFSRSLPSWVWN